MKCPICNKEMKFIERDVKATGEIIEYYDCNTDIKECNVANVIVCFTIVKDLQNEANKP